jgi:hypothetical protein
VNFDIDTLEGTTMGPKPSALPDAPQPKPWPPVEGQTTRAAIDNAVKQLKQQGDKDYVPPHGQLPGPHQLASRSNWDTALSGKMTDIQVPGDARKNVKYVPFPHRANIEEKAKKLLPTKPGKVEPGPWMTREHGDTVGKLDGPPKVKPGRDAVGKQWPLEPGTRPACEKDERK